MVSRRPSRRRGANPHERAAFILDTNGPVCCPMPRDPRHCSRTWPHRTESSRTHGGCRRSSTGHPFHDHDNARASREGPGDDCHDVGRCDCSRYHNREDEDAARDEIPGILCRCLPTSSLLESLPQTLKPRWRGTTPNRSTSRHHCGDDEVMWRIGDRGCKSLV